MLHSIAFVIGLTKVLNGQASDESFVKAAGFEHYSHEISDLFSLAAGESASTLQDCAHVEEFHLLTKGSIGAGIVAIQENREFLNLHFHNILEVLGGISLS